ncbi:hypothetical protein D3C87_1459020 [compost metagenome]
MIAGFFLVSDSQDHYPVRFPVVAIEHHITTVAKSDHQFLVFKWEKRNRTAHVRLRFQLLDSPDYHFTGFSGRQPVFGFEKVLQAL